MDMRIAVVGSININQTEIANRCVETMYQIDTMINLLSTADYIQILHKRYIEHMSVGDISDDICLSYDRTRHILGDAVATFWTMFGKECKRLMAASEVLSINEA